MHSTLRRAEKLELLTLLEERKRRNEGNKLKFYRAYACVRHLQTSASNGKHIALS